MQFGGRILLVSQIIGEREREPVDIGLEKRWQRADAQDFSRRERLRQLAAYDIFVVDGYERARRNLALQRRIASCRDAVGISDEQHDRHDAAADGLFHKSDFFRHLEEFVERMETEVDPLGDAVIDDHAVHQRHLAEGVVDFGRLGNVGQIFQERRLLQIDVEGGHFAALQQQKFAQQTRNQRLSDQRAGRANDVNGRVAHHALYQAKSSLIPVQSGRQRNYFSPPRELVLVDPTMSVSLMRSNSLQTLASQCRTYPRSTKE